MTTEWEHWSRDVPSILTLQNNVYPLQFTFKNHTTATHKKMQKIAHNISGKFTFIAAHGLLSLWTLGWCILWMHQIFQDLEPAGFQTGPYTLSFPGSQAFGFRLEQSHLFSSISIQSTHILWHISLFFSKTPTHTCTHKLAHTYTNFKSSSYSQLWWFMLVRNTKNVEAGGSQI